MKNLVFSFIACMILNNFTFAQSVICGSHHVFVNCSDNTLWGWGAVDPLGVPGFYSTPPTQITFNAISLSGGFHHSLAVKPDSTVWGWGNNYDGQLGTTTGPGPYPPMQTNTLSGVTAVSAGFFHSMALRKDSTVWMWGTNSWGQFGNGTDTKSNIPVQSSLSGIIAISAGYYHSLFLKADGTVWASGLNDWGLLGNGTNNWSNNLPTQVVGLSGVTAIAASKYFSLALKNDSTVWAWGSNNWGQLGNGTNSGSNVPVQVSGLTEIVAIDVGSEYGHAIALKKGGTVWTWGDNGTGQLGIGNNTNSNIPVKVNSLIDIVAVGSGQSYCVAIRNNESVWAWGDNGYGELGDQNGPGPASNIPKQVFGTCFLLPGVNELNVVDQSLIYPNPTSGMINVKKGSPEIKICIRDVLGNCIFEKVFSEKEIGIDLSDKAKGIYFVEMISQNKRSLTKVAVQ